MILYPTAVQDLTVTRYRAHKGGGLTGGGEILLQVCMVGCSPTCMLVVDIELQLYARVTS